MNGLYFARGHTMSKNVISMAAGLISGWKITFVREDGVACKYAFPTLKAARAWAEKHPMHGPAL